MKRVAYLCTVLLLGAATATAQPAFVDRGFVLAELFEVGPFATSAWFGSDGSYTWLFQTGDSTTERRGTFATSDVVRRIAPFGDHEYGRIRLEYVETVSFDGPPVEPRSVTSDFRYAFANDVLVLYTDDRIVELFADHPEAVLYQVDFNPQASSELTEELASGPVTYSARNVRPDASLADFWAEGVPGSGEGSSLDLSLSDGSLLERVVVWNGVFRREDLYSRNARVREMVLSQAASRVTVELPDWREPVVLPLDGWPRTSDVRIDVMSVYPGTQWEDLCLSSIVVLADAE